ncbi:MAG: adenosine deaminase [Candidatus Eremiobacteraeota bacterium]|nr:adenosine deaminase [Candidatus Eremiobacteraeota bacterium]
MHLCEDVFSFKIYFTALLTLFVSFILLGVFLNQSASAKQPDIRKKPLSSVMDDETLHRFLHEIPKVDLHRHLEGDIKPKVFMEIARKHNVKLPADTVEGIKPYIQMTDKDGHSLLKFLKKFDMVKKVFVNKKAISKIAYEYLRNCSEDNIKYVELRFSPFYMASAYNLDKSKDVIEGVIDGVKRGKKDFDIDVRLIFIIERQMGPDKGAVVEDLLEKYRDHDAVALDLANDEAHYPPGPYAGVYQKAKRAGLKATAHAGEAAGPDNVKVSILDLEVDRIGHGVTTYKDKNVEKLVKDRRIPLEMCPTSNLQTGVVKTLADHPLKRYYDEGIIVTINTDDPAISGIDLTHEYFICTKQFGFTIEDIEKLIENSINSAFLSAKDKNKLRKKIFRELRKVEKKYNLL